MRMRRPWARIFGVTLRRDGGRNGAMASWNSASLISWADLPLRRARNAGRRRARGRRAIW
jgi:hypothetical protein